MKNKYCHNCHHPYRSEHNYCSNCGQKNIKGKIRLLDFLKDVFSSIFNWDSKIWITPIMLFKPGFLTVEFFKGRRSRYTHPGKMLFFLLVVYSAFFMYYVGSEFDRIDEDNNRTQYEYAIQLLEKRKDSIHTHLEKVYPKTSLTGIVDTIQKQLAPEFDVLEVGLFNSISFSSHDLATLSDEELIEKYNVEGYWEKIFLKRARKIQLKPGGYLRYVMSRISWIVLASIPFMGIVLMLLYIRKEKYYVEHIVFLSHVNAFIFLLGVLSYIIGYVFNIVSFIYALPFLLGIIYIYFAMKTFYGQSHLKTFMKYTLLVWASFFIFTILAVIIFGVGLFLF